MRKNLLKVAALFFAVFVSVSAMAQTVALQDVKKDAATYEVGDYKLVNDWIRSTSEGNFVIDELGGAALIRSMAAYGGKMYFPFRGTPCSIIVVDGATGNYERTITLDATFKADIERGDTVAEGLGVTLANNDIRFDSKGNCLVGPCTSDLMLVYKVDLETGACTPVIKESLKANPDFKENQIRFDAFGVWGDVNDYAVILAVNASALDCYRWVIEDGVAGPAEQVFLDPFYEGSAVEKPGTAPIAVLVDENNFYLDGQGTLPTLYQYDGEGFASRADCFYNEEGKLAGGYPQYANSNGVCEFEVENKEGNMEYFMVCANSAYSHTPALDFTLLKFADENRSMQEMEVLYTFPQAGFGDAFALGGSKNTYMHCPVYAESDGYEAAIYCYAGENGFAKYTFTAGAQKLGSAIENVEVVNVYTEGALVVAEGEFQIFTVTGQNVTALNGNLNAGAYIVKTANVVAKVIVK